MNMLLCPRRFSLSISAVASLCLSLSALAQTPAKNGSAVKGAARWPSVETQLAQEYDGRRVESGSALETLIREHQDFSILRAEEANDKRGLPAWLRVWWRQARPDATFDGNDPTGGYPHVLKEVLEWMMTHQDLKAGPGESVGAKSSDPDATNNGDFRISGTQTAARSESDIRVNFFDPSKILAASNNISGTGQQGIYFSINSGSSWSQSLLPLVTGDAFHSDPTAEWTSDGRAWSSTLGINAAATVLKLQNYFSTDNGLTWTYEATVSGTQTNVDKQMVWVDHSSTSPFFNQMYAIWHNGNPAFMNRRTAGAGGTWGTPTQVSGAESSGTCIGADVKTNRQGDVFGAWPATTSRKIFVVKSTNGGASYSAPIQVATTYDSYDIGVPAFNGRRILIYVTLGTYRTAGGVNNVYATWTDLSGQTGCTAAANEPGSNAASTCKTRIWFARSTDGGATWSTPVKINNQSSLNDQFNQWLAVDETSGGIAITYYDTVGDSARKKTDVWYQSSSDGGATWSAALKVTSGTTDETITGADSGNQYGDYNGLSGYATTFFPSWTDRRSGAKEEIWSAKIVDNFTPPEPAALLSPAGAQVAAGSCSNLPPTNVNPGQTASVFLCVNNTGDLGANNVVGTLQATGGVTNPSGPQSYGSLPTGGAATCRLFTFTPSVACGSNVTATLQLQDSVGARPPATFSFTTGSARPTVTVENFDGVTAPALPAGWTATNAVGATPLWVTTTTTPASAPNAAFVDDPSAISDKRLESPGLAVSSTSPRLSFRQNYDLESGFDGGVLEVSAPNINAGAFTDVTNVAVGGTFLSNGYNSTISASYSNPIGGRAGWSGNSGGYLTTVVDLGPNLAGQTVKLRFRMGSDSSVAAVGWRVDTITFQDGFTCSPLPVSAVSRKTHGSAGDFDVPLPLSGTSGVEPRAGGATGDHRVVVTFASALSATDATVTSGAGGVSAFNINGAEATIDLTGVANASTTTVTINGASTGANVGCVNVPLSTLLGDSNGDRVVNGGDALQTRSRSGAEADSTNFRSDFNHDGVVNIGDTSVTRTQSGSGLP